MINVPGSYSAGLALLRSTPTGRRLVEKPELASVIGVTAPDLDAHGRTTDRNTIELTTLSLPAPHQACLLAHELTHCLDLAFWNADPADRRAEMTGATEVNAHYNQGLIARELRTTAGATWSQAVSAMINSNTSYGRMADARERMDVIDYLDSLGGFYQNCIVALRKYKIVYVIGRDEDWTHDEDLFHCEQHLALSIPHDRAW